MKTKVINVSKILELYSQGLQPIEIGEELGCSNSTVLRHLKLQGIKFKRDYSKHRRNRLGRHLIDEDFFNNIDTEAKAYFLGLMYSDGSVSKKHKFYLKLKDEDIIIKFKECLCCDYPIRRITYKEFYAYVLEVCSKKSCENLIKWGCTPNKTRTIQFPNIDKSLYRHFIRGFFDGDGCLQLQDKIYHCRFDLTSASKLFLEQVRPIITEQAFTNGYLGKEKNCNVYHLNYSGHQVEIILDWLYANSNFYLQRKYNKYQILKTLVHLKQGELLENPQVDNQQPSYRSA